MMVELTCEKCGVAFAVSPYYAKRGQRFCSLSCAGVTKERSPLPMQVCEICGIRFKKKRHIMAATSHNFCSWGCYSEHRRRIAKRGPEHPYWRGGRDDEQLAWASTAEARRWRAAVIAAAGSRCRECGASRDLHAHHALSFRDHPEARTDVANGVALCRSCHTRIHHPKGVIRERAA